MSGAGRNESLRLQLILGPRHRPRAVDAGKGRERTRLANKYIEHRFSCEVRIGARTDDLDRSRRLIGNVAGALRGLEATGVALRIKRSSLRALDDVRSPLLWPNELGISEVTALLGWPIAPEDTVLPGVPSTHPRMLPVPVQIPYGDRILGYAARNEMRPVAQSVKDAKRALHALGPMGTGKSTLIVNMALADAAAGRSVVLLDAKDDAINDFLERLEPQRHDDVVLFEAGSHPVGVSAFGSDPERSADVIFGVFKSLYNDQLGPRSSDLLHAALLTMTRAGGLSLSHLPVLLSNSSFRRPIVAKVAAKDPLGLGAFWAAFEALSDAERIHVVAPLRNKLDPVLTLRPSLRAMFGQSKPKFELRDLFMDPVHRPIVLIPLGSATLGPEGARLVGSILLALIWQAAQERTRIPQVDRHPVMLYADEFQEVTRLGDLADVLSRSRGLGVAFAALAHQSLTQLSPATRQAVLAHAASRICFRLSHQDAKEIAATTNGLLTPRDFTDLPAYTAQASLLTNGDNTPWCTIITSPLPPPRQSAEVVKARARSQYGVPIEEVETELLSTIGWVDRNVTESFGRSASPNDGGAA